jgi:thioredoxin reductase (NADPH)
VRAEGAGRIVELSDGGELSAHCVLIASGVSYKQLDAPGFSDFTGAGVYYGAAPAEARSCAEQHIAIIGGANSAGQAAVHFSGYATTVTVLVRGDSLDRSMSTYLIERLETLDNVNVRTCTEAIAAEGEDGRLRRLILRDREGAEEPLKIDACFVFIGASPHTDWLEGFLARDERGFILAGADVQDNGWALKRDPYPLETSVPGVFVAGDVRARSIKRVASAVGEGSMAVSLIHQYLANA